MSAKRIAHHAHLTAAGRFRLEVLDASTGRVVRRFKWRPNLLTNRGLDGINTRSWAASFSRCVVGTGTAPMHIDSGAITASRAGTTVTAGGVIFDAAYVGAIIKWDSGEEATIASFTSTTAVETTGSGTIAAGEFTIHRVNLQVMSSESKRSNTYVTGASNCGASRDTGLKTNTLFRTFIFTAEGAPVTYNEIGISETSSAGANLNARAIISGGVSLAAGQQLRVKYSLTITLTNSSAQTAEVLPITGIPDQNATQQVYLRGIQTIDSNGAVVATTLDPEALEPSSPITTNKKIAIHQNAVDGGFGSFDSLKSTEVSSGSKAFKNATKASYTNGNYYVDFSTTFSTSEGNFTIGWLAFGNNHSAIIQQMDTPFAKTSDDTLALAYRLSWGRELVN